MNQDLNDENLMNGLENFQKLISREHVYYMLLTFLDALQSDVVLYESRYTGFEKSKWSIDLQCKSVDSFGYNESNGL